MTENQLSQTPPSIVLGSQALNGIPINPKSKFFVDTERIYGIYHTNEKLDDLKDQEFIVKWTSLTNPNEEIFSSIAKADPKKQPLKDRTTILFDLENKKHDIPLGKYKVEFSLNSSSPSQILSSRTFDIVKRKGIYLGYRYKNGTIENPTFKFNGHSREIFGVYHFSCEEEEEDGEEEEEEQKGEEQKNNLGHVEWKKILKEDEEMIFQCPILEKINQTTVQFSLPRSGKHPFSPGTYKCCVFFGKKSSDVKNVQFEILEPKPDIFLGTNFSKFYMDILDNRVIFPHSTDTIRGIFKFCKTIDHKKHTAGVRWLFIRPYGSKQPLKPPREIEKAIIPSENDFNMIVFKLEMTILDPGLYCCEIYLDQKHLQKRRFFHFKPRTRITLEPVCTHQSDPSQCIFSVEEEGREEVCFLRHKVCEMRGEFSSNAQFSISEDISQVIILLRNQNEVVGTSIVHLDMNLVKNEKVLSNFTFFLSFEDSVLEAGDKYSLHVVLGGELIFEQKIVVVEDSIFEKEKKMKKI